MNPFIKIALPLLTLTQLAQAEPTLYPASLNSLSAIVNKTNSNILADETDPTTIWVMPPNTASATVSKLHNKTAYMGRCSTLRELNKYSAELQKDIADLMKKRVQKSDEIAVLQAKASELHVVAEKFAAEKGLTALMELDSRISAGEQRLSDLYAQKDKCTDNCDLINDEIRSVIAAKTQMMKDRNELARQNADDSREYTRRRKTAEAADLAVKNAKSIYMELAGELDSARLKFDQSFDSYGKMEGASASISYTSTWDNNVSQLRASNPGFNFSKLATKNAVLMTEQASFQGLDPRASVIAIAIPGSMEKGLVKYSAYPEALSATAVLSLIGACPIEHPEYFDIKDNEAGNYGVIITYEYDSIFTMKATAHYNYYKMYQKIVSSGSSGGLFSSSSWTNEVEKNFFRDSFSVEWNDKENTISAEDKDIREAEMRASVLSRLAAMALPNVSSRADALKLGVPPANGAAVLSGSLRNACPANVYCIGASIVLDVLNAIFGSSSSTSSYTHITEVDQHDEYIRTGKITKAYVTSYLK